MKITEKQLKQLIKEEIQNLLKEDPVVPLSGMTITGQAPRQSARRRGQQARPGISNFAKQIADRQIPNSFINFVRRMINLINRQDPQATTYLETLRRAAGGAIGRARNMENNPGLAHQYQGQGLPQQENAIRNWANLAKRIANSVLSVLPQTLEGSDQRRIVGVLNRAVRDLDGLNAQWPQISSEADAPIPAAPTDQAARLQLNDMRWQELTRRAGQLRRQIAQNESEIRLQGDLMRQTQSETNREQARQRRDAARAAMQRARQELERIGQEQQSLGPNITQRRQNVARQQAEFEQFRAATAPSS